MFEKITPEQAGISSEAVIEFIEKLEKRGATMHSLLFMKGDKVFTEAYWKPFHQGFCHRQYSQTKSFVGIAIGLLEEEGKLSLDDKIVTYFPDKCENKNVQFLENQTIREMLMMTTIGEPCSWFLAGNPDRTHLYMNTERVSKRPSGMLWQYDSAGSQVLSSLVERLSGKKLLDYLKEKLFNEMKAFQTATVLQTPNGDSWGDSAMVCTLRDMATFGRFVMNYGVWNGKRLMNEKYLREATSSLVNNSVGSHYSTYHQGYGYQIWRVCGGGFAFVGMGDQLTVCYPEKDLIFACNSDNQGTKIIRETIFSSLEEMFVGKIKDVSLQENLEGQKRLNEIISRLKLRALQGMEDSSFRKELNGVEYVCAENPMGITKFSFIFTDKNSGEFHYTNAQGDKVISFGVNNNVFGKFPQYGYSDEYGATPTTNKFLYDDAVSLAWLEEKKLILSVQIIDRYLGNMDARFCFKGNEVYAVFQANAEYFLMEYQGALIGRRYE